MLSISTGDKKAALIDTGYGMGDIKSLTDELTDLPITVVTTHTHVDHIGQHNEFSNIDYSPSAVGQIPNANKNTRNQNAKVAM